MSEPLFLTVEQVGRLHEKLNNGFGGTHGLRELLLFEGAVIHPRNVYYYAQGDVCDVAAAYAFHIAQAQEFLDDSTLARINQIDSRPPGCDNEFLVLTFSFCRTWVGNCFRADI